MSPRSIVVWSEYMPDIFSRSSWAVYMYIPEMSTFSAAPVDRVLPPIPGAEKGSSSSSVHLEVDDCLCEVK